MNDVLSQLRTDAAAILRAAVDAADPFPLTRSALQRHSQFIDRFASVSLVAAGKAAWPMTAAAIEALGERIKHGVVTGPRGDGTLPRDIQWIEGAHPRLDERSIQVAHRALEIASGIPQENGLLLTLLSGGGSSMMGWPVEDVTLEEKQQTIDALSNAGVPITGINCVRKHLSVVKGGWLGSAAWCRCLTLAVSDVHVPQDHASTIASGPTVVDPTTFQDALGVIDDAGVQVPESVREYLELGAAGRWRETAKPGDRRFLRGIFDVIANRRTAMDGAAREARQRGYAETTIIAAVQGEASSAGREFAQRIGDAGAHPGRRCLVASGETTVRVRGSGRGGRNQEFVLAAALGLAGRGVPAVVASAGTDGIDGPTDAAGGIVSTRTVDEWRAVGIDPEAMLRRNDAYPALDAIGALIRWGPTHTNVGDVHVLLQC